MSDTVKFLRDYIDHVDESEPSLNPDGSIRDWVAEAVTHGICGHDLLMWGILPKDVARSILDELSFIPAS